MDRRQFGKSVLTGAAAAMVSCQQSPEPPAGEAPPMKASLDEAQNRKILRTAALKSPIIIESIDLLRKEDEFFIRVRSADGAEGIAVPNSRPEHFYPILNELVIPYFVGKDARNLEEDLFGVYRWSSNYKLQGQAFWCPISWVEFALLDLMGRVSGQPLHRLVGDPVRNEIDFYIASSRRDSTAEEEVEHLQSLIEETGAKAVKYRVGGRMSRNEDALPGRTEALIPLSRQVLGDQIAIHADSNSSYDSENGIRVGRLLEEIDAVYFEEPCPFDHLEETKIVTDTLNIPVSGGEQESSEYRFRWMIENRGVDIVQPDLQYYGGLIRSRRVAEMAEAAGMPTTVHISGGFGFIYMLHFAAVTKSIGRFQEYKRNIEHYSPWFVDGLTIRDGKLGVPSGPGVGIADVSEVLKGAVPFPG